MDDVEDLKGVLKEAQQTVDIQLQDLERRAAPLKRKRQKIKKHLSMLDSPEYVARVRSDLDSAVWYTWETWEMTPHLT